MHEVGNVIILTQKEYDEYVYKAKVICSQRENRETINMRLRFPYYIPTPDEVEKHKDLPMSVLLPYYIYLTVKDDKNRYIVEPDDEILNETREYMRLLYESRIYVVDNTSEEKKLIKMIKQREGEK